MEIMESNQIGEILQEAGRMRVEGISQDKILAYLVKEAEKIAGDGSVVSIMVLDEKGLLRNASSPKLPADYLSAIDGLKPDANVGTCAAAAATGTMVITNDFRQDNKWAELRHLPIALGFSSAWSMPIKSKTGCVIGTFGTYYRKKRSPSQKEIDAIGHLANAAAEVLSKDKVLY